VIDLDGPCTQAEFGALVGVSQPAVSGLVQRGILGEGETAAEWLLAYCDALREVAAGRSTDDGSINLVTERAKLARSQRERVDLQNAEKRKELAPVALIEQVLAQCGARAASILDTIPGELRRRVAGLSSDDIRHVGSIVAKARNLAASVSIDDLELDLDDEGSRERADDDASEAAA
jgi:phage terminase Nu1 subunit (DNA packaging protein)